MTTQWQDTFSSNFFNRITKCFLKTISIFSISLWILRYYFFDFFLIIVSSLVTFCCDVACQVHHLCPIFSHSSLWQGSQTLMYKLAKEKEGLWAEIRWKRVWWLIWIEQFWSPFHTYLFFHWEPKLALKNWHSACLKPLVYGIDNMFFHKEWTRER